MNTLSLSERDRCILEKVVADFKLHSLQNANKNTDEDDLIIGLLRSQGNYNQILMIHYIITHYSLLPVELQIELENCAPKRSEALRKCEMIHGKGKCVSRNIFTAQVNCPEGYVFEDDTRCVRKCNPRDDIKKDKENESTQASPFKRPYFEIDYSCSTLSTFYYSEGILWSSEGECESMMRYKCDPSEIEEGFWVASCPLNFQRIAFLCVPMCFDEFEVNQVIEMKSDPHMFCIKDYVELSLPFYDL